jgi:hypothetical protein
LLRWLATATVSPAQPPQSVHGFRARELHDFQRAAQIDVQAAFDFRLSDARNATPNRSPAKAR